MVFSELPTITGDHAASYMSAFQGSNATDSDFSRSDFSPSASRLLASPQLLSGNRGSNTLEGRSGNDVLKGRDGNDRLKGLAGNDKLYGEGGNDRLFGGLGNDWLNGGTGLNTLNGEAGNDQLIGGSSADQLVGGSGDDRLSGQGGRDRITGGAGRDRFLLTADMKQVQLSNAAQITDFKDGEDWLELAAPIKFSDLAIVQGTGQQANQTLIQNKATGEYLVILNNVQKDTITASDFWGMTATPEPEPQPGTDPTSPPDPTIPATAAVQTNSIKFSPNDSEATIAATGAARIQLGSQTIYIGTQQASSINQNPLIASFDATNPANNWVRTDYEVTGADGRGYGLFWSGSQLYGVFSVDGTQGTPDQDFRRVSAGATQPWLRSYGSGGGAKVAVLARLNPATGEMSDAVYLSAILSTGKSNSFAITNLSTNAAGNVVVQAQSYYAPRRPDGTAMTQVTTASSPFAYTLEITPDLKTVVRTAADGWS